jgi:hypothetical protein
MGQLHSNRTAPRLLGRRHHHLRRHHHHGLRGREASRRVAAQNGLHTERFTHRTVYTQNGLQQITHRTVYTQNGLHTERFSHRTDYTHYGFHTEWFTHRTVFTQNGLHTERFTHLVQQLVQPRLLALVDLALQAAGGARAAEEHRGAAVDGLVDAERLGSLSWCLVGKEGKGEVAGSSLVSGGTR